MANAIEYISWRGDIKLTERGLNDADNIVFSSLAYIDFSSVAAEGKSATLAQAAQADCPACISGEYPELLCAAGESQRFGSVVVKNYVALTDNEEQTQFCAMCFVLPDKSEYIAFRGTDDTIVAWREDFCMSFEICAAQKHAAEYLNGVMKHAGRYYVGGHSKGGNLAVFGSMMCDDDLRKRIVRIYNNDGPGICPERLSPDRFDDIKDRITRIVPEHSIIGMLFENTEEKLVAKSTGTALLQHFPLTWQLTRDGIDLCEDTDRNSQLLNSVFDSWIEQADDEHRRAFTDEFFGALSANGAVTIQDVVSGGIGNFAEILHSILHADDMAKETMKSLFSTFAKAVRSGEFLKK